MGIAKILIVDDDTKISALMRVFLECGGYEVLEENRSFAALATARKFHPQLILLDVDMPGKDGGVVAREIGADPELSHTPVIFITSLLTKHESGNRGKGRFLGKPFDPADLLSAVRETLTCLAA